MFSTLLKREISILASLNLSSANTFNLDQSKNLLFGKELKLNMYGQKVGLFSEKPLVQSIGHVFSTQFHFHENWYKLSHVLHGHNQNVDLQLYQS